MPAPMSIPGIRTEIAWLREEPTPAPTPTAPAPSGPPPAEDGVDPPPQDASYNPRGDLDFIDDQLSYAWNDWVIFDSEVDLVNKRVSEVVTDDKRDVNKLFDGMSEENLERWASNLDDDGKRDAMLGNLVTELSGKNAARLARHFGHEEVAEAVAKHASAATKADFVTALQGEINSGENTSSDPGVGRTTVNRDFTGNEQARAAGRVLSSLAEANNPADQAQFDRTVRSLAQAGELDDVLQVAYRRRDAVTVTALGENQSKAEAKRSFDPGALLAIIDGASKSQDPAVQAAVLTSAGKTLAEFGIESQDSKNLAPVSAALGRLITDSPHTGKLLEELRKADPRGAALTDLLQSFIVTGDGKSAGAIARAIQDKGSPEDNGYFRASLALAVDDLKGQIDGLKRLQNYGINGAAIIAGLTNVYVGIGAALGAAVITTDLNTGADEKQQLDKLHGKIRDTIVYPASEQDQQAATAAKNQVLQLNDKEHLIA
jgi:hypothetical protein